MLNLSRAGFFPGAVYIVGTWYPPNRTQVRAAMFFCAAAIAGAFSGLLAGGIAEMDGIAGLEGWRWIFILEGIATVIAGVAAFWLLPSKPSIATWLTPEEKRFLELTQIATRGRKNKELDQKQVWSVLRSVATDYKVYMMAFIMYSNSCAGVALFYMLPQIIRNMGFTSRTAQFLSAP
jgi:MFS family permease